MIDGILRACILFGPSSIASLVAVRAAVVVLGSAKLPAWTLAQSGACYLARVASAVASAPMLGQAQGVSTCPLVPGLSHYEHSQLHVPIRVECLYFIPLGMDYSYHKCTCYHIA